MLAGAVLSQKSKESPTSVNTLLISSGLISADVLSSNKSVTCDVSSVLVLRRYNSPFVVPDSVPLVAVQTGQDIVADLRRQIRSPLLSVHIPIRYVAVIVIGRLIVGQTPVVGIHVSLLCCLSVFRP
mgnify:CR=1 FL=1